MTLAEALASACCSEKPTAGAHEASCRTSHHSPARSTWSGLSFSTSPLRLSIKEPLPKTCPCKHSQKPMKCERCMSFVTTKPRSVQRSAVHGCGMDPTTLSFPSTAVAIRETITQRQAQSFRNVCATQAQSRDLNYCGPKTTSNVN